MKYINNILLKGMYSKKKGIIKKTTTRATTTKRIAIQIVKTFY